MLFHLFFVVCRRCAVAPSSSLQHTKVKNLLGAQRDRVLANDARQQIQILWVVKSLNILRATCLWFMRRIFSSRQKALPSSFWWHETYRKGFLSRRAQKGRLHNTAHKKAHIIREKTVRSKFPAAASLCAPRRPGGSSR